MQIRCFINAFPTTGIKKRISGILEERTFKNRHIFVLLLVKKGKICYNVINEEAKKGCNVMVVAVCDDERVWADELSRLLKEYGNSRHIDIFISYFNNGSSLVESGKEFDIIFMDYQMDGLNGIETSRKIRALKPDGIIIFVSAYTNVAMDTFEVKAYRFLAKPINKEKLFKAIDDYRAEMDSDNFLIFKTHEGTIRIKVSEIIYVEGSGNHSKIHTIKSDHEINTNLKPIQNRLPPDKFVRCHKAYITSFLYIQAHDNTMIKYDDGSSVYISRNFLPKFRKAFEEYILKYNTRGGAQ